MLVKRIPKSASAKDSTMLIDHWLIEYEAIMVEGAEGSELDIRQHENKNLFNTHITER